MESLRVARIDDVHAALSRLTKDALENLDRERQRVLATTSYIRASAPFAEVDVDECYRCVEMWLSDRFLEHDTPYHAFMVSVVAPFACLWSSSTQRFVSAAEADGSDVPVLTAVREHVRRESLMYMDESLLQHEVRPADLPHLDFSAPATAYEMFFTEPGAGTWQPSTAPSGG